MILCTYADLITRNFIHIWKEWNPYAPRNWLDFMRSKKGKVSTLLCFCLFVVFVFVLFSQKLIFQFQLARKSMFLWKKKEVKKKKNNNYFLIWTFVVSHSAPQKKFEKGCQLLTPSLLLTSSTLVTVLLSPTAIWRSTMIPPFRTNLSSSQRKTLPCRGLGPHY